MNIENKPQFAKDQNNCNKPERNINKFEQVSIKEKESLPPSQKLFLLPQENNNKKKNIETNKVKEQMDLKQERKRKNLENKKVNLEKRLEEMEKIKHAENKNCQYFVNKYMIVFFCFFNRE